MKFVVSGFGRSGTLWLATLLNRATGWTVLHEHGNDYQAAPAQFRFRAARGNYGEVSSYLLPCIFDIPVDRRAVVVRDPLRIAVSAQARGHRLDDDFSDHLCCCLALIDAAIERGATAISFERMTTDVIYLTGICRALGMNDFLPTLEPKLNASAATDRDWQLVDAVYAGTLKCRTHWYRQKYAHLGAMRL